MIIIHRFAHKVHGEEHPDVAITLNNLAGVLMKKGEYDAAEDMYRRVLEIRTKVIILTPYYYSKNTLG